MADDLKPCPFCGSRKIHVWEGAWPLRGVHIRHSCTGTFLDADVHICRDTQAEAIAAWNTRAIPAALAERDAEIGRLREASERVVQAHDIGWDMQGVVDELRAALSPAPQP